MELALLSWNIAGLDLLDQVAAEPVDVALLQEVPRPQPVGGPLLPDPAEGPWRTEGWKQRPWRTAILQVSDRVHLLEVPTGALCGQDRQLLAASRSGTLTAADVIGASGQRLTLVSWYATWEHPPGDTRVLGTDAAAHRLLCDVAALIDHDRGRHLVIAGDLNLLFGYGEHGGAYWADRYRSVFKRAAAMGLDMVGPQAPNGHQAQAWPAELPRSSRNVPTCHTRQQGPAGAARQLGFVFASRSLAERVRVTARNQVDDWGPSDHCRISIDIDGE